MAAGDVTTDVVKLDVRSCAKFDGVDDKITVTSNSYFEPSSSGFSYVVWFKPTKAAHNAGLFSHQFAFGSNQGYLMKYNAAGTVGFWFGNTSKASSNNANINEWNCFLVSFDGSTLTVNLNGTEVTASRTLLSTSTNDSYIGSETAASNFFQGFIREAAVYNRPLSSSERTAINNNLSITDGLIANWKLDGNATDSVGSNDGSVTGAIFVNDESNVADFFRNARASANDKYFIDKYQDKVILTHVEES